MWPFVAIYVPDVHGDIPPSLMVLLYSLFGVLGFCLGYLVFWLAYLVSCSEYLIFVLVFVWHILYACLCLWYWDGASDMFITKNVQFVFIFVE